MDIVLARPRSGITTDIGITVVGIKTCQRAAVTCGRIPSGNCQVVIKLLGSKAVLRFSQRKQHHNGRLWNFIRHLFLIFSTVARRP